LRPTALSPVPSTKNQSLFYNLNSPNLCMRDLTITKAKKSEAPFLRTAVLARRKASKNLAKTEDLRVIATQKQIRTPVPKPQRQIFSPPKLPSPKVPTSSLEQFNSQIPSHLPPLNSSRNTMAYSRRKISFRTVQKPANHQARNSHLQAPLGFNLAEMEQP